MGIVSLAYSLLEVQTLGKVKEYLLRLHSPASRKCTKFVITMLTGNTTRLLLLPVMPLWNG